MRPLNYVQEFKSVAQEHERRHSGEKRYECKTCAKKYADSKSKITCENIAILVLRRHIFGD